MDSRQDGLYQSSPKRFGEALMGTRRIMVAIRSLPDARYLITILSVCVFASFVDGAEPTLRALDIRGLRVGGTTTLTIDGDDLGPAPRLLLPFAAKQTLKAGATDKKAVFEVTLADDVVPGYHHLRVVADGGVSLPVVI